MNAVTAKNALAFLARVDLKGSETPAFQEVVQALNTFAGETITMPAPEEENVTEGGTSPE